MISGESIKQQISLLKLVLVNATFFLLFTEAVQPVEIDNKH